MLALEWLVAIIGGYIQAPLDQAHAPLLRMMRRGSEIAVKFSQVLYMSVGFGQTKPALRRPLQAMRSSRLTHDCQVSLFGNSNLQNGP